MRIVEAVWMLLADVQARADEAITGHGPVRRLGQSTVEYALVGALVVAEARCHQGGLEAVARRVAGARVVPALVGADTGEFECRRQVNRDVDGARKRIGVLARVHRESRKFRFRHN